MCTLKMTLVCLLSLVTLCNCSSGTGNNGQNGDVGQDTSRTDQTSDLGDTGSSDQQTDITSDSADPDHNLDQASDQQVPPDSTGADNINDGPGPDLDGTTGADASDNLDQDALTDSVDSTDAEMDEVEVFVPNWDCPSEAIEFPPCNPEEGPVAMSGFAYVFGPPWGVIPNAPIKVIEFPDITTTTNSSGYFKFDALPRCSDVTLELEAPGFTTTRTETFRMTGPDEIQEVAFQVPTIQMRDLLAGMLAVTISPDACQMATTVSVKEMSLTTYLVPHGVPDSTVTICPAPGPAALPIYFEYVSDEMIYPSYELTSTSPDGGVLFVNVPPGDYILRAFKEGSEFPEVRMKCEAGAFVNASPPKGLHEMDSL